MPLKPRSASASPFLLVCVLCMTALLGCAQNNIPASSPKATPTARIVQDGVERIMGKPEHPLASDLRKVGEAVATFWRLEQRYPSSLEELKPVAEEYRHSLELEKIKNLALKSLIFGTIQIATFDFPFPESTSTYDSARVELDSANSKILQYTVEAGTLEGKTYLDKAIQAFLDEFEKGERR
jgi:hypothetical protein